MLEVRNRFRNVGLGCVQLPRRLPHTAGLHHRHEHVQVLQLDPPANAIAELHTGRPYEFVYPLIHKQYYPYMAASTIVATRMREMTRTRPEPRTLGGRNEAFASQVPAAHRKCYRRAGLIAHRESGSLSSAAGSNRRWLCTGRWDGHYCPSDWTSAERAAWTAIHRRKSTWSRRQHRHGGGRQSARGWLHAAPCQPRRGDQCDALRKAQL